MKVPLYVPWITDKDKSTILKGLQNPHLTDGPKLRILEKHFSKKTGTNYAIGVSNGTAALHLSLLSLNIGKNDEVLVPDYTFAATANAVFLTNAKPVLVDIDKSLNISEESILSKINKKTKAIIPVHFAGLACNMKKIIKLSKEYNLKVIEDCAHSFGTLYKKKHVGSFGDVGCFSMYPTKNITTIEGGMIVTNSKNVARKSELLRNHGLSRTLVNRNNAKKPWDYDIITHGYNYRLDEIRSRLGISQILRSKKIRSKRIGAAKYYNKKLPNDDCIEVVNLDRESEHSYHLYIIRIKEKSKISRNSLHEKLFKSGIKTTVHYKPLHMFSYFKKLKINPKDFPLSENAYTECLTLPLFPTITRNQQDFVIKNIQKYVY